MFNQLINYHLMKKKPALRTWLISVILKNSYVFKVWHSKDVDQTNAVMKHLYYVQS
jgi:hypothetical protein